MQVSELEEEPVWPVLPSKKRLTHAEPSQYSVVECAQGALFGRILGAQWALRKRSSAQRPRFPGRFDGRSE